MTLRCLAGKWAEDVVIGPGFLQLANVNYQATIQSSAVGFALLLCHRFHALLKPCLLMLISHSM